MYEWYLCDGCDWEGTIEDCEEDLYRNLICPICGSRVYKE